MTHLGSVQRVLGDLAPIDHLVVTIAAGVPASSIPATSPEIAAQAFGRFWSTYNLLHSAPGLVRQSVTVLSGSSSKRPVAGFGVWGTLHRAIEGLALNAAIELAPLRVNVVSPGGIGMRPDRQLLDRVGQPDDVAAMILALAQNPAITATVVDVDSGERLANP